MIREITEGEVCCGSAGAYNLLQPVAHLAEVLDASMRGAGTSSLLRG